MAVPSASYSITVRLEVPADPSAVGRLTTAVGGVGATVQALDVVESHAERMVVDVTCAAVDANHTGEITRALEAVPGIVLRRVSDRTFLLHLGGKIEVTSKVPLRTRDDLSMAYTPGVARVCLALAERPEDARRLTIKRNSIAVVTDGSAVLGLGNLGPAAALPVMEGKAALFKRFADVDAWPICLDTQDTDEIVRTVQLIAPGFGGINLEDIAAPRCFEVERRLRDLLDIPVFHDDQHGTAIVVLAALTNALRVVDKELGGVRIVLSGAGAAGSAAARLLVHAGARSVLVADVHGVVHPGRPGMDADLADLAQLTNAAGVTGTLRDVLAGSDVLIGLSAPNILSGDDIASMADGAVVFALANPDPEVDLREARQHAAVVASGRSDEPNQINNVLAFPGVFRGLLDSGGRHVDLNVSASAAAALSAAVADHELNASYILPSVFDAHVAPRVAQAVSDAVVAGSSSKLSAEPGLTSRSIAAHDEGGRAGL